jgi:hypothetical protein
MRVSSRRWFVLVRCMCAYFHAARPRRRRKHLAQRATSESLGNLHAVLSTNDDASIPRYPHGVLRVCTSGHEACRVYLIIYVNTYHKSLLHSQRRQHQGNQLAV